MGIVASKHIDELKVDVGLAKLDECTQQENSDFAEMEKSGRPLPEDIRKAAYDNADGQPRYYRLLSKVSSDKEELYLLMRISKDLHFIKVLFEVLLVLSIIIFLLSIVISR